MRRSLHSVAFPRPHHTEDAGASDAFNSTRGERGAKDQAARLEKSRKAAIDRADKRMVKSKEMMLPYVAAGDERSLWC